MDRSRTVVGNHFAHAAGVCLVILAVLAPAARAADAEHQRRSLTGIAGVHVHLALHGEDLEAYDLNVARLQPVIESRLQAAGLKILSVDESTREPGVPWLFVTIGVQKSTDTKAHAWSIRVELEQRACLERQPTQCQSWPTWGTGRFGSATKRRVKTIDEELSAVVDEFGAAWRGANGR